MPGQPIVLILHQVVVVSFQLRGDEGNRVALVYTAIEGITIREDQPHVPVEVLNAGNVAVLKHASDLSEIHRPLDDRVVMGNIKTFGINRFQEPAINGMVLGVHQVAKDLFGELQLRLELLTRRLGRIVNIL
ncbi:hypothetical protein HG530_001054 [Fusarium avenaceum]|nr:hypothetical protein HG530_001054 [Fusarium avenaceum]